MNNLGLPIIIIAVATAIGIVCAALGDEPSVHDAWQTLPDTVEEIDVRPLYGVMESNEVTRVERLIGAAARITRAYTDERNQTEGGRRELHGAVVRRDVVEITMPALVDVYADGYCHTNSRVSPRMIEAVRRRQAR